MSSVAGDVSACNALAGAIMVKRALEAVEKHGVLYGYVKQHVIDRNPCFYERYLQRRRDDDQGSGYSDDEGDAACQGAVKLLQTIVASQRKPTKALSQLPVHVFETVKSSSKKIALLLTGEYAQTELLPQHLQKTDLYIWKVLESRFTCTLKTVALNAYYRRKSGDNQYSAGVYQFDGNEIQRLQGIKPKQEATRMYDQEDHRMIFDLGGGVEIDRRVEGDEEHSTTENEFHQ